MSPITRLAAAGLFIVPVHLAGAVAPCPAQCEIAKLDPAVPGGGDQFGDSVVMRGNRVVVGAPRDRDRGFRAGSVYVFRHRDNGTPLDPWDDFWEPKVELYAPAPASGAEFGTSVGIDGVWLAVGAPRMDFNNFTDSGVAYAYRFSDNGTPMDPSDDAWVWDSLLRPTVSGAHDKFGSSIAIIADHLVVGASGDDDAGAGSGAAYVFRRDDNGTPSDPADDDWVLDTKLTALDGDGGDSFGGAVSIDGDRIVVGAMLDDKPAGWASGSAYVFRRDDNATPSDPTDDSWVQEVKLSASDASTGSDFGRSVVLKGEHIVVGSPTHDDDDGVNVGAAYVFRRDDKGTPLDPSDDVWVQEAKLSPSNAPEYEYFGGRVSISGDRIVAGATSLEGYPYGPGAAYLFERGDNGTPLDPSDDSWSEVARLLASDGAPMDGFGGSVAVEGDWILSGAPYHGYWGTVYAFALVSDDCNCNGVLDAVDIASGTSLDCNGNGVPDECEDDCNASGVPDDCDVAGGTSEDCNANLIPDECEPDCNGSGLPDDCDIANGTSFDCGANGIPDECEPDCQEDCSPDDCDIASGGSNDDDGDGVPDECAVAVPGGFRVDFSPRVPLEGETVTATVSATFGQLCYQICRAVGFATSYNEFHFDFYVRYFGDEPGSLCIDMITTQSASFTLPALEPRGYHVTATLYQPDWDDPCEAGPPVDQTEADLRVLADCNGNGLADSCDLIGGTSKDCNANAVADECEPDCDASGVPDDCECLAMDTPAPELAAIVKSRYLSFVPDPTGSGCQMALRVTLGDLPPPFETLSGSVLWVGEPRRHSENAGARQASAAPGFPSFHAATLQCDPHYTDWSDVQTLHVYHPVIVPGAVDTYAVQAIEEGCDVGMTQSYSHPWSLTTSGWADVGGPFDGTEWVVPDGTVTLVSDVMAILEKFRNQTSAVTKARADIHPDLPDQIVSILDVTAGLDAFRGSVYPFPPPDPCP